MKILKNDFLNTPTTPNFLPVTLLNIKTLLLIEIELTDTIHNVKPIHKCIQSKSVLFFCAFHNCTEIFRFRGNSFSTSSHLVKY